MDHEATPKPSPCGTRFTGWTLDLFKHGKLPSMLERAGYPTIAAALDEDLVAAKGCEVETTLQAMAAADPS